MKYPKECIPESDKSVPDMSQQELDTFAEGLNMIANASNVSEAELLDVLAKYVKRKEYDYLLGESMDQHA